MCISGIYSLNNEIIITQNGLSTSVVDIEIDELNQDSKPFNEDGKMVMPGDEIILIPKINNLGDDCFIRTKIEYIINNEKFEPINYIHGNYNSWSKKGDYFYYESPLKIKDSINLFNKVIIPDLSPEYYGKKVVVHIVVEAVQARNFKGNWDNVKIKKSIDRTYDIDYEGESSIIYEDSTNNHITIEKGFFDKLEKMLPGDSISEIVKLLNKSDSKNEYYLSIDYDNLTNKELELLQNIKLTIKKQNGDIVVESNLADKNNHVLGIYKQGKGDNFSLEVTLPEEIDNDFSKIYTKIKWKFSYKVLSRVLDAHEEAIPETGDFVINTAMFIFIISSIGLLMILILWKIESKIWK